MGDEMVLNEDAATDDDSMEPTVERIALSLVSHTNTGKTTLARTFLRRDVGEVLDQAHVTDVAESHPLVTLPHAELQLWDTPGFGDSARLLKRLKRQDMPIVWFMQQTWDRIVDRPFWCSQQAAINVRQEADAVLYLVNATEEPADAGYLVPELDLLGWIGRPILVLLNQTGGAAVAPNVMAARIDVWRQHLEPWSHVVRDVVALDAFSRCWVQEGLLFERLIHELPEEKRDPMRQLTDAWNAGHIRVFERSIRALASYLTRAATDRETLPDRKPSKSMREQAMQLLSERLGESTRELMTVLLTAHGLEGQSAKDIERQIDAFVVQGIDDVDPERGALLGSIISGAVGGLTADLLAGGLTFGGGVLAGAILGALGGAGLARGYQMVKGQKLPAVSWSGEFLDRLGVETALRYLAVAHFGRGRGEFLELETPQRWRGSAISLQGQKPQDWSDIWRTLADRETTPTSPPEPPEGLVELTREMIVDILLADYPEAHRILRMRLPAEERDMMSSEGHRTIAEKTTPSIETSSEEPPH